MSSESEREYLQQLLSRREEEARRRDAERTRRKALADDRFRCALAKLTGKIQEAARQVRQETAEWAAKYPAEAACIDEALAENSARDRAAWARRGTLEAMRQAGCPADKVRAWPAGFSETPATQAVRAFMTGPKTFLLLLGSVGAGKTMAAVEAIATAGGGLFVDAQQLARVSGFDSARWRELETVRLLVLDDLGAELLHDGWRPNLEELINHRYNHRLRTVITTNLDLPSFKAKYGERIVDRIRETGSVASCGGQSMRGQETRP